MTPQICYILFRFSPDNPVHRTMPAPAMRLSVSVPKPTNPDAAPLATDRRRKRLEPPPCDACASASTRVVVRTDFFLYVRCSDCGFVWSLPKPARGSA